MQKEIFSSKLLSYLAGVYCIFSIFYLGKRFGASIGRWIKTMDAEHALFFTAFFYLVIGIMIGYVFKSLTSK